MSNTITIELCAEDRARLDAILAALSDKASAPAEPAAVAPVAAPEEAPAPVQPEPEKPAVAPAAPAVEEAKPIHTKADLLAKVQRLIAQGGKKAEARAIIKQYADRVSDVPADKIDEVMAKLAELEG